MSNKKHIGLSLIMVFALAFTFTSCERSYDDPTPLKVYTEADFDVEKETFISIADLKKVYYDNVGSQGNEIEGYEITDNLVLKAKIITDDKYGNIYRTAYVQDETGAIEIKTGLTGFYTYFGQGETVYVMCKGLILGNYRYMLSLGRKSSNPAKYSNGFMDVKIDFTNNKKMGSKFLKGGYTKLTEEDIKVVTSADQLNDNMLGRLIRFEGLTHTVGKFDDTSYPSFLEQVKNEEVGGESAYNDYLFTDAINAWNKYYADSIVWVNSGGVKPKVPIMPKPGNMKGATWGFKDPYKNLSYFGTALFKFGSSTTDPTHNLTVRTSGYSRFANELLPKDGQKVNITAIYGKHSASSGGWIKYQLTLNNITDVELVN